MEKRHLTIGYIAVHAYEDIIAADTLKSINQAAKNYNVNLIHISGGRFFNEKGGYAISTEIHKKFMSDKNLINKYNFDGLIFWGPTLNCFLLPDEIVSLIKSFRDIPTINIGSIIEGIPSVLIDNHSGIEMVLNHLIEHHGFTKIAFIPGDSTHPYSKLRLKAYCNVLKKNKIPLNQDLITPAYGWFPEHGRKAGKYLFDEKKLKPKKDIEAIVTASDKIVVGLMDVLREKNYSVPNDIALTGFNNKTESRAMVPALTTVDPFFTKLGYVAFEKLYNLIQGDREAEPVSYSPADLVIRQSCGCFNRHMDNSRIVNKGVIYYSKSGVNNIQKQKEEIFNNIITELKTLNYNFDSKELKEIFNIFIDDLFKTDSKEFLRNFEQYTNTKINITSDPNLPVDFISFIRKFLSPYLNKPLYLLHCEDLLQQARIMTNHSMACAMEAMQYDYSAKRNNIVYLGQQLNSAFDIKKLSEHLKIILQNLEIEGCYIRISPDEKDNYKNEKQLFYFENGNCYHTVGDDISDNLLDNILPSSKRISLVINPLVFHETKLGIIIFRTEKEIDTYLLETLRGTISVALKGAIIIDERKRMQKERDRMYEEAVRANKAKSEFLANMSHEIRTPLNAVLGLNYLLEKTDLDETQKEYTNQIQYSAQLLLNHINDLLDFSKIEAGKLSLEFASFNLLDTLENLIDIMRVKSEEKRLDLNTCFAENIPDNIIGDKFRLEQVLMNLISNAIKFTEKGEVSVLVSLVSISEKNVEIKFSVQDSGIGLTEEQQKKLFNPFTQADTSTTRKFGGTGLGLSISQSLVKLLGGEISLESEIDKGSTFFFTLPFKIDKEIHKKNKEADTIGHSDREHIDESIDISDKKILIVEDNKINQVVAKEILNRMNADTTIVENGQEAVNYLSDDKNSINLILMDLQMPVLDGFNATLKIRELPGCKNTPIIALTADIMPESRSKIFNVGMNDILLKPISPESLYEKVHRWAGIKNNKTSIKQNRKNIDFSILNSVINTEAGIHYTSKNEELYCKLLFNFFDTYENYSETFTNTIENNDTIKAAKQMHALKGTAGTLGMAELYKVTEEIEAEIKKEKTDDTPYTLSSKLENSLLPVLKKISEFRKNSNNRTEK